MTIRKIRGEIVALPLASYDGVAKPGEIVVDEATYFTYIANGTGQLNPLGGGGGGGTSSSIVNGTSNVSIPFAGSNVTVGVGGAANVVNIGPTQVTLNSNIVPNGDAVYSLGAPGAQFKDLYLSNTTLYLNLVPITVTSNSNLQVGGLNVLTDDGTGNVPLTGNIALVGNIVANSITANSDIYGSNAYLAQYVNANLGVRSDIISGRTGAISIRAFGADQNVTLVPNGNGTVDVSSKRITSLTNPIDSSDAATKIYVDGVASGLSIRPPVAVASTTNLVGTYLNGVSGVGATLTLAVPLVFMDGYTMQIGDRVLIKDQTNAIENGIYVRTSSSIFTRATDSDVASELDAAYVFVQNGAINAKSGFVQTATVTTVGTNNITFVQFSDAGDYVAGAGLQLSGSTFSIANTGVTSGVYGTADTIASLNINSRGQITAVSNISIDRNAANLTGTTLSTSVVNSSLTSLGTLTGLTVNGLSNLGDIANVRIMGGTNGQVLVTTGAGLMSWANVPIPVAVGNGASNVAIPVFSGNVVLTAGGVVAANVTPSGVWATNVNVTSNLTAVNLTVSAISNLGANSNVKITGGSAGQVLVTNGSGDLSWVSPGSAGSAISNGSSNVDIATSGGAVTVGVGGTAGVLTITSTGANVVGTANISGTANLGGALNVGGVSNLGPIGNVIITGGTTGQVLTTDGLGTLSWGSVSAGSATSLDTLAPAKFTIQGDPSSTPTGAYAKANIDGETVATFGKVDLTGNLGLFTVFGKIAAVNNGHPQSGWIDAPTISFGQYLIGSAGSDVNFGQTNSVDLGAVGNLYIPGGTSGQVLSTDGLGNLSWATVSGGSGVANGTSSVTAPALDGQILITSNGVMMANYYRGATTSTTQLYGEVRFHGLTGGAGNQVLFGVGGNTVGLVDFQNTANVNLGAVANVHITGGTNGQVLSTDGSGTLSWTTPSGGGSLANGSSNVSIPTASDAVNVYSNGQSVASFWGSTLGGGTTQTTIYGALAVYGKSGSNNIFFGDSSNTIDNLFLGNVKMTSIASASNISIGGGLNGYVLSTDGSGGLSWINPPTSTTTLANGTSSISLPVVNGPISFTVGGVAAGAFGISAGKVTTNFNGEVTLGAGNVFFGDATPGNDLKNVDFTYTGNVKLGGNANVQITGGTSGQVLSTDGSGGLSWVTISGAGALANGTSSVNIPGINGAVIVTANGQQVFNFDSGSGAGTQFTTWDGNLYANTGASFDATNTTFFTLPTVANISFPGGTSGQVLTTDGTGGIGGLSWTTVSGGLSNGTSNVSIPTASQTVYVYSNTALVATFDSDGTNHTTSINGNALFRNGTVKFGTGTGFETNLVDFAYTSNVNLGAVANVHITGGTNGQVLTTDGSGALSWTTVSGGGLANGTSNVSLPNLNGAVKIYSNGFQVADFYSDTSITRTSLSGDVNIYGNGSSNLKVGTSGQGFSLADFTYVSNVALGPVANVKISGGTSGQVLTTDGSSGLSWTTPSSIANGTTSLSIPTVNGDIIVTGNLIPAANVTYNLGSLSMKWNAAYFASTTIYLGDTPVSVSANNTLTVGNVEVVTQDPGGETQIQGNIVAPGEITANGNITTNGNLITTGNLIVSGESDLGAVGNITITGGTTGQVLTTNGSGGLSWTTVSGGGGGSSISNGNASVNAFNAGIVEIVANSLVSVSFSGNADGTGRSANFNGTLRVANGGFGMPGGVDFTSAANVALGAVGNIKITGGTNGQVLTTDGAGNLSWATGGGGGSSTNINNGNSFVWIPDSDGYATVIVYNDANTGVHNWNFNRNGNLQFPNIGNTQMSISGTTRTIAADPHPASGTGSVVVWTASGSSVCGAKMTLRAKNTDGNIQMMEIMMAKDINNVNVNWTVSNRVKTDNTATDIPITVSLSSNKLRVTATVGANHAFTYTVDEFQTL